MTTEVTAPSVPIYVAGEFAAAGTPLEVRNPADDSLVATTFSGGADELERATVAAARRSWRSPRRS
jgi:acyl-CoA reductase-like NAD-dependent aldehyde dehydrogenase